MRPNHEYWCKCTWQTSGINKTATSDRLDLCWQLGFQWHRRGIELVFKSPDCFTKRLFHSVTILLLLHMYLLFETSPGWLQGWRVFCFIFLTSIWWGSTQLQCIYYLRRILISRLPRVFQRFKRRSCSNNHHEYIWQHYWEKIGDHHLHLLLSSMWLCGIMKDDKRPETRCW